MAKYEVTKMTSAEIAAYIDREAQPFIELNNKAVAAGRQPPFSNPHLEAIRYELVKRPDGSVVKKERRDPLLAEVGEIDTSIRVGKLDSEKVLSTRGNGKYNDENKLLLSEVVSVEVGEVQSFRDLS